MNDEKPRLKGLVYHKAEDRLYSSCSLLKAVKKCDPARQNPAGKFLKNVVHC